MGNNPCDAAPLTDHGINEDSSMDFRYAEKLYNIGLDYDAGKNGKPENKVLAAMYYRWSADIGYAPAQNMIGFCFHYGIGVEPDYDKSVKYYRMSAEQGYARAICSLGLCYFSGTGVEQNKAEAVRYYRISAEHNCSLAQFFLGVCYHSGSGIEKDPDEAKRWLSLAAENGNQTAKNMLKKLSDTEDSQS